MSTAIERFKMRKAIMASAKSLPPAKPSSTQSKKLADQKVDMEFVNAPSIYEEEIKSLKEGTTRINKILQGKVTK